MKAWISSTLLAVAMLGSAPIAQAQTISRIIADMGLSPADFEILSATSAAMLADGTPRVGEESTWVNDDTGSKGTVRVRDVRDNCVHLQHFIQPEGADQTREVRTRRCRDAGGNWILTP
jgi:surface antigen